MNRVAQAACLTAALWMPSTALAADSWPAFRGPSQDGVATASGAPLTWGPEENVAWRSDVPGSGWSTPVVHEGRVYLTAAVGTPDGPDGVTLRVLAYNLADGAPVWDKPVLSPPAEQTSEMHQKNSLASPSVLVAGDRLLAHFGHMGSAVLSLDGDVLWTQTELTYEPRHGTGSSPAVVDGLMVISCDGEDTAFLAALDLATGEVRWRTPRTGSDVERKFSFATPTVIEVGGVKQIISPASGYVAAYAPADGSELWRVDYGGGFSVVPQPVYTDGLLYVCSGFMRPALFAIDPAEATGDVTETHVVWRHDRGVPATPSVLVADGLAYFVSDRGVATCLDARTGEQQWTERLGGGFSASPVLVDGRVLFTNEEGATYAVRAARDYELLATNNLAERTLASPAVLDGALLLRTESKLWRIEQR